MPCARLMRGISSMANSATPDLASAAKPSASENGSSMPITAAPVFIALYDVGARPPHGEHDIGAGHCVRVRPGDIGAGLLIVLIGEMRPEPRAGADFYRGAGLDELLDRLGGQPDARLVVIFGGNANHDHQESQGSRDAPGGKLAPVRPEVESELGEDPAGCDERGRLSASRQTTKIAIRAISATTPTMT